MRPGSLVELKPGLFGLQPPQNLGVYLERRKRKKEFLLVVVSLAGVKEIKRDQVTKRRFDHELDVGSGEQALMERLKQLIADRQAGKLEGEKQKDAGGTDEWSEQSVWEKLVNRVEAPMRPEGLVELLLEGKPSRADLRRLEGVLEACRRDGVGFFERAQKGHWSPIPVGALQTFQRVMESNHRLRKRLVETRSQEDEEGETLESLVGVHPGAVELSDEEGALLAGWKEALSSYVLHDGWQDQVVPPECRVHTLGGRSYHRFLEHFVLDWTGVKGVSRSSAALQFLVDGGLLGVPDAIRLVAKRRVLAAKGFTWESPEEIERWAERYREPAEQAQAEPGLYAVREDLRGLESYTIDPPDAKDFDDAVALKEHANGSATLWVHIADVSHYVEKDSRLDHHARERATSVYLPTGVLPMLPRRLSEDLCSLRAQVDRLAMGVRLEVDPEGRVVDSRPYEAVIRVAENASYQEVDEAIENDRAPFSSLYALSKRMRRHRMGLQIETGELRIRFVEEAAGLLGKSSGVAQDDDQKPSGHVAEPGSAGALQPGGVDPAVGLSVHVKRSSPATRMIETFMVAANEAVAGFVADNDVGVPFRCHPLPERAKAKRFTAEAKVLGLDVVLELPSAEEDDGEQANGHGEQADEAGDDLLAQLKGGKLQLGGFAASETIGSAKEKEDEAQADETTGNKEKQGEEDQNEAESSAQGGVPLKGFAQLSSGMQAAYLKPFAEALEVIEGVPDEAIRDLAYQKLLSTLGRALYTPKNVGHFGLGSVMYGHFTSPIRRYPDLVLHRQLRWLLAREAGRDVDEEPPHAEAHLMDFCAHCSGQSQAAERLEWDLLATCLVFESRRETWAGAMPAIVTGITSGGVFLSLPANLEAYLAMRDIPGGPYEVDENGTMVYRSRFSRTEDDPDQQELARLAGLDWRELEDPDSGELREARLKLGDRVKVQIRERDLVEGKVRVRLAGA